MAIWQQAMLAALDREKPLGHVCPGFPASGDVLR